MNITSECKFNMKWGCKRLTESSKFKPFFHVKSSHIFQLYILCQIINCCMYELVPSTWAVDAEESFNYTAEELSCFYLFVGESDGGGVS